MAKNIYKCEILENNAFGLDTKSHNDITTKERYSNIK